MIHSKDLNVNFLRLITFVYVPTILMVFNYVLLYHVHEKQKLLSTLRSGTSFRSRFVSQNWEWYVRIALLVVLSLFVIVQLVVVMLVSMEVVSVQTLSIEMGAFILLLLIAVNAYATQRYFRMTGHAYKN